MAKRSVELNDDEWDLIAGLLQNEYTNIQDILEEKLLLSAYKAITGDSLDADNEEEEEDEDEDGA